MYASITWYIAPTVYNALSGLAMHCKDALKSQKVTLSDIFCTISFQEITNQQILMWNCTYFDKSDLFTNCFLLTSLTTVYTPVHLWFL